MQQLYGRSKALWASISPHVTCYYQCAVHVSSLVITYLANHGRSDSLSRKRTTCSIHSVQPTRFVFCFGVVRLDTEHPNVYESASMNTVYWAPTKGCHGHPHKVLLSWYIKWGPTQCTKLFAISQFYVIIPNLDRTNPCLRFNLWFTASLYKGGFNISKYKHAHIPGRH